MLVAEQVAVAFEETVEETLRRYPMRILGYCWLPNHWHFVLRPEEDGQLSAFLQRLTNTRKPDISPLFFRVFGNSWRG